MKKDIQPEYNQTTITCACGNVLEVGSTKKESSFFYFPFSYARPYFFLNLSALPPAVSCLRFPVQNG